MCGHTIRTMAGVGITRNMDGIADGVERILRCAENDRRRKNAGLKPAFFYAARFSETQKR